MKITLLLVQLKHHMLCASYDPMAYVPLSYLMLLEPHLLHSSPTLPLHGLALLIVKIKPVCRGVLKKLQRSGFLHNNFQTFIEICEAADAQLFSSIIHNDDHVLHQLLPPVKTHSHNLRKPTHDFVIPRCDDSLMRKNFIIRLISANSF